MNKNTYDNFSPKIIEKIRADLKEIKSLSSVYEMREKVQELMDFIDYETVNNRTVLEETIYSKVIQTKDINPELHTYLYILYRNLTQKKITLFEARKLYDRYLKQF